METHEIVPLPDGVTLALACPRCGNENEFQEEGSRASTQPFVLEETSLGLLQVAEWDVYETGDDVDDLEIVCRPCEARWPSLDALELEMRYVTLLTHLTVVASEAVEAIGRSGSDELNFRIAREALAEGARLDPRDMTRPDPEPFVRAALLDIIEFARKPVGV